MLKSLTEVINHYILNLKANLKQNFKLMPHLLMKPWNRFGITLVDYLTRL